MSNFTLKRATRQGSKPLIGLYSESGCGKTYSALMMARGFVGPTGKIVLCDSESGRGSLYADVIPGGYETLELGEPFSPARYIEALRYIEESGANICILDSASHEWEGLGGVLDLAGENESKSGRAGLHNWRQPKMEHAKFVLRLLRSPLPIIVCLRAKYKTRQVKENGKTQIIKDDYTTPIQADDFIFEMTAHGEIMHDHSLRLTKCSHPGLLACFAVNKPITVETGQKIAAWCANPKPSGVVIMSREMGGDPDRVALKQELWSLTKSVHMGKKENVGLLQQWLIDEAYIDPDDQLDSLSADRLRDVLARLKGGVR